jgi:hypothetical protein
MLKKLSKGSWKTTAGAVLGALILLVAEVCDALGIVIEGGYTDGQVDGKAIVVALMFLTVGVFARDNDRSSEDVGAGKSGSGVQGSGQRGGTD